jgi:hypothetical protein
MRGAGMHALWNDLSKPRATFAHNVPAVQPFNNRAGRAAKKRPFALVAPLRTTFVSAHLSRQTQMFYLWADPTAASAATSYGNVCSDVESRIFVLRRWRPDSQCDAMPRQNASRSQDVARTRGHSAC